MSSHSEERAYRQAGEDWDDELRAEQEEELEEGPIAHCAPPPDEPRPGIDSAAPDRPGRELPPPGALDWSYGEPR
jgi:hypothetical protein